MAQLKRLSIKLRRSIRRYLKEFKFAIQHNPNQVRDKNFMVLSSTVDLETLDDFLVNDEKFDGIAADIEIMNYINDILYDNDEYDDEDEFDSFQNLTSEDDAYESTDVDIWIVVFNTPQDIASLIIAQTSPQGDTAFKSSPFEEVFPDDTVSGVTCAILKRTEQMNFIKPDLMKDVSKKGLYYLTVCYQASYEQYKSITMN